MLHRLGLKKDEIERLPPRQRVEAGIALAALGDPHPGEDLVSAREQAEKTASGSEIANGVEIASGALIPPVGMKFGL